MKEPKQRTLTQNRALHKFLELVAEDLAASGRTFERAIPPVSIPWSPEAAKIIWRAIQESMFGKVSTRDLTTKEIDQVYDVYNLWLAENFDTHIPWPSVDEQMIRTLTPEE